MNFHFLKNKGKNVYLFRSRIPTRYQAVFQKKQFTISLRTNLQQDAKNLSHHLYHYCQRIYQSIGSGYSQLTLAQIKQLAQQELQKYRQQIGLTSSIRFEAAEPLMKLSDLLNEFLSFKQKNGASHSSVYRIEFIGKHLIEACSNVEVSTINHGTARKFYDFLDKLELKTRSKQTYASAIIAAFNWAVKQGFVKTNYFSGKITLANKDDITSAKQPFSADEMKLILGPKLLGWSFLEHNTVRGRFGKRRQPTPDYYWVVNIAAYTGARLGEIVQLTTDDVESKDDIWCFSFNNRDGKRIKNLSSCRQVPVHPKLLELGLLDHLESCQKNLFEKAKMSISNWFSRKFLTELALDATNRSRSFHSLRHTVVTHLTDKQVFPYFVKELVGHKHNSITYDIYAGKPPMKVLLEECVSKINYCD